MSNQIQESEQEAEKEAVRIAQQMMRDEDSQNLSPAIIDNLGYPKVSFSIRIAQSTTRSAFCSCRSLSWQGIEATRIILGVLQKSSNSEGENSVLCKCIVWDSFSFVFLIFFFFRYKAFDTDVLIHRALKMAF